MKLKQPPRRKSNLNDVNSSEKGIILIITLALLAIIALVATVVVNTTNTDVKISGNYKTGTQAFYAAEAGIQEARARLIGSSTAAGYVGDPDPFNGTWTAYIMSAPMDPSVFDPDYSGANTNYIPTLTDNKNIGIEANSLQTAIPFFVKLRHKREYDAELSGHTVAAPHYVDDDGNTGTHTAGSPGNIIYWGYGTSTIPVTPFQFTSGISTRFEPVEIILGAGTSSTSLQIVVAEVVHEPGPAVVAAVYSKGNLDVNGASAIIDGVDICGETDPLPPIYVKEPGTTTEAGGPTYTGNPAAPSGGDIDIDIQGYVDVLKDTADVIIIGPDDPGPEIIDGITQTYYFVDDPTNNTDHKVGGTGSSTIVGSGVLLVEGDLTITGNFSWAGLIVITGVFTISGGGSQGVNISGAVLANQTVDINGSLDIEYNSCALSNAFDNASFRVISWKQEY